MYKEHKYIFIYLYVNAILSLKTCKLTHNQFVVYEPVLDKHHAKLVNCAFDACPEVAYL